MSEEQNKAIARRFFEEAWNQQKDNVIDDIFASTIVLNGQSITRDALKQAPARRRNAFSDIHVRWMIRSPKVRRCRRVGHGEPLIGARIGVFLLRASK